MWGVTMNNSRDLIVIGGGAAGLTAAGVAANLGAKTLLVERDRLGGDCTWTGCIPSKALLNAAKTVHMIRQSGVYGVTTPAPEIDFAQLMRHVNDIREGVYHDADRPEIYESMGVEVQKGDTHFVDDRTIEVRTDSRVDRFRGRYVVIAAGARPLVPPIDGLQDVAYLTNESVFELRELPRRLTIIGAGPVGTEMAQAFNRLGTSVTVVDMQDRILSNDDEELATMLQQMLSAENVRYVLNAAVQRVDKKNGEIRIHVEKRGESKIITGDALLLATGRRPNLESLNLEAAGVAHEKMGITVDDRCRTSVRHVFAVGDVTGRYQFTHMSEHMAKVAVTNALLKWPMKIDAHHVPWATFTDPELANVGATAAQLTAKGARFEIYRFPFSKIDRAATDGRSAGLIKVFATKLTGKILGATVLGHGAGEMIGEFALAMRNGVTLRQISDTIHPYPTYGLGVRRVADQWYIRNHSPRFVRVLQRLFGYRGTVNSYEPEDIV